jgi:hypothetical protein
VRDATEIEKRGKPAAVVLTKPFTRTGEAMAKRQGYPGFRFAIVDHPMSSLSEVDVEQRALEALPQVLEILGLRPASANAAGWDRSER